MIKRHRLAVTYIDPFTNLIAQGNRNDALYSYVTRRIKGKRNGRHRTKKVLTKLLAHHD